VTVLTDSDNIWINQVANRLRLIQSDAASATPEARRELLNEEVARNLKDVPAANRKPYLEALLVRFPVGGQIAKPSPAVAPVAATPVPVDETPEAMLERFLTAMAKLPEEKHAEVAKRLEDAGLVRVDRNALILEVSDQLRQKLALPADQQPRLTRLVELAGFVVDALCDLDRNALKTMRELSPRCALLTRSEDFRASAARFLVGQSESLETQWQPIRALLGGLLAAIQGGGRDFGRQYVERLSPSAIEDVVVAEGDSFYSSLVRNRKERCWDKYKDLAGDFATADLVDRRIKECLAQFVETIVRGGR